MPWLNRFYERLRCSLSRRCPKAFSYLDSRKSVFKFIVAGGMAGGTDLVFLFFFHGLLRLGLVLSTSAAFILSFVVSFTLQKFWTFRNHSRERIWHQFFMYILVAVVGLNLNGLAMHFLVINLKVWYLLAQVIVNISLGVVNFLIYKFIIFRCRD